MVSILMAIASIYPAYSIELLANYKLWQSVSPELAYDFSGNSRHASLRDAFIVTDRGLRPSDAYKIRLMKYGFLSLEDYVISVWMLNYAGSGQYSYLDLYVRTDSSYFHQIRYVFDDGNTTYTGLAYYRGGSLSSSYQISRIIGWNLHTMRIYKTPSNPGRLNINLYLNLSLVLPQTTFIDSGLPSFTMTAIILHPVRHFTTSGIIVNEVWVHRGFSTISDLNYLVSDSSHCGCEYKCPTTPSQTCLQPFDSSYNKSGQLCDSSCTSASRSCDSVITNCIPRSKAGCQYGLYDTESSECIFYCPNSSCICPSIVDSTVNTLLSCSCKSGYKKISEYPQACISNRCLEYHKVGHGYACDNTEFGYSLNNSGECCICTSGFTQKQADPLICVNTAICLGHIISGNDYTCSSCADGYIIYNEGKCITKIDNCSEYVYVDDAWKCLKCRERYFLYERYINNFICPQVINSCADYTIEGITPVCDACKVGFYLSESKNECFILNCSAYEVDEDKHYCSECSIGYQIDSDGKCNKCSDNYEIVSEDAFTCLPKIEHCSSYQTSEGGSKCQECKIGYKVGSSGLCDECEDGFILIESESLECKVGIYNCLDYEIYEEVLRCMTCKEGYSLDLNNECTLCDSNYMHHLQDTSICIREILHCLEYEVSKDTMVCIECEPAYNLDYNSQCITCAQGYIYMNNSISECVLKPENSNQDSGSGSTDNTSNNEEEAIPEVQIQRGKVVESLNNNLASTTVASTVISSIISKNPSSLILYLNMIKILSLIQYLNINLPFEVRKQQSSTSKHIEKINILSYISIHGKDLNETLESYSDDEHSFLAETIYQFMILVAVLIMNLLIYCITRCAKGKLKELGNKILAYFKYNIYIQLYMITYLDIIFSAISKIVHVISI